MGIFCKIRKCNKFLDLGLERGKCLGKDFGQKAYAFFNEFVMIIAIVEWYLDKKIKEVDIKWSIHYYVENFVMCVIA